MRFRDPAGTVRSGEYADGTVSFGGQRYDVDEVDILPPTDPSKVVCIGRNYVDHADEMGGDVPDRPMLFLKGPNAGAPPRDRVRTPSGGLHIDHEAELGVVIGEDCRAVEADDAMRAVAGFTCVNDLSNRTDQRQEQNWVRGKAFDGAAPMGPVIATPDEVPQDADIVCRVNGERRQAGTRNQMAVSVPELIAEITRYCTLERGDVIATGTPEGVGRVADGDRIEIEIEGIGTLEHRVAVPE
jgi:2-keto-4-pentenoate hydratase/2-oxohepta-3-ene-1,7-dioic acid hydratase in catechol pathway